MTTGIHHVTGITSNVQANVDFYVGFLGLKRRYASIAIHVWSVNSKHRPPSLLLSNCRPIHRVSVRHDIFVRQGNLTTGGGSDLSLA